MAAPFVTGLVALINSHDPNLDNDEVMEIIKLSAVEPAGDTHPGWDQYYGHGLVNAADALDMISWPYSIAHKAASGSMDMGSTSNNVAMVRTLRARTIGGCGLPSVFCPVLRAGHLANAEHCRPLRASSQSRASLIRNPR